MLQVILLQLPIKLQLNSSHTFLSKFVMNNLVACE